ncbi:MAG: PQQ-binding-like beta-propeller repeat protein [Planctomycetales bacterium]|nr:PQQ-binding-like beta-propeller repeat protein [Planctomycetales bacterium]MBN8627587.1 PQQ-binding-like beta-propeller repeat protein [Planctomycetota bacterium]
MTRFAFVLLLVLAPAALSLSAAEPSVYFRSNSGIAAADAVRLPAEEVESDDVVLWRTPLASGHSSPCVCGERIFLTTFADGKLATVGLDRASGKVLWTQPAPHDRVEQVHPAGSPATSTPACDGERVVVFFGSYGLLCYNLDGKVQWQLPLGPFQDEFGSGSSPVLVDGCVLLNQDHDRDNFLLCLDAATGKTLWRTAREGTTRSYATPVVAEFAASKVNDGSAKSKQILVAGALQLTSYDFATGKPLWSIDGLARIVNTTPLVIGDMLYVATWSPGGDSEARIGMEPWNTALAQWDKNNDKLLTREECDNPEVLDRFYRIDLDQSQKLDEAEWVKYARVFELAKNSVMALRASDVPGNPPKLVWQTDKNIPYVPSPLVYRGALYMIKDGGILSALAADDGRTLKVGRVPGGGKFFASPVAGDGKIYLASDKGTLVVVKAADSTKDELWEVLASRDFDERTVATPALVDGRIYFRTEAALYCLGRR